MTTMEPNRLGDQSSPNETATDREASRRRNGEPEVPWVVTAAPPTKLDRAIRLLISFGFPGTFEGSDPAPRTDPKITAYMDDAMELMRRKDAGELSPEEYAVASREIAARAPQGQLGDGSPWAYLVIPAIGIGIVILLVIVILAVIGAATA
jgi:hypothetical protein